MLNWQENGDQAISLADISKNACMTVSSNGKNIIGDHCRSNVGVDRSQQWNLRGHAI